MSIPSRPNPEAWRTQWWAIDAIGLSPGIHRLCVKTRPIEIRNAIGDCASQI